MDVPEVPNARPRGTVLDFLTDDGGETSVRRCRKPGIRTKAWNAQGESSAAAAAGL